jgi:hypothetical protein
LTEENSNGSGIKKTRVAKWTGEGRQGDKERGRQGRKFNDIYPQINLEKVLEGNQG